MDWIALFTQFGYLGVFLISFIGALSVVVPVPYTLAYYYLGTTLDPLLIAIAGGLGSAVGEISGYALGYFGQTFIGEERKRRMVYLMKIFDRYGPLLVFFFALTPLPDDMLFISLGISRYNFTKAFIPCLLGKTVMAFIIAYSGKISFEFIKVIFGDSGWIAGIITFLISLIVVIAMLLIDWEVIFKKYVWERE